MLPSFPAPPPPHPPIILTTDFGIADAYVGVMKGVIHGINPRAPVIDLTHQAPPQDLRRAAFFLAASYTFFPEGAIHVVVVDPGVGTARRPMAARLGDQVVVGPDNGLVTLALERAEAQGQAVEFFHLNRPAYWLPEVSHVFHGRDIFSPVAAHLAAGAALEDLGEPFHNPVRMRLPQPARTGAGWQGEIVHIDHFGNLSTNIRQEHLGWPPRMKLRVCGVEIDGMVHTFGERPPGALVALYGSTGNLIVSVVNGSAAGRLQARTGDGCEVIIEE